MIDYDYVVGRPIFGGELGFKTNFVSLSRSDADFDAITKAAMQPFPLPTSTTNTCTQTANPAIITSASCLLRGIPGDYNRLSTQAYWKSSVTDSLGQVCGHLSRRCGPTRRRYLFRMNPVYRIS